MNIKWEWTVPNVLSLFRIALVPLFAVLYLISKDNPSLLGWAIATLVVSGLTDMFDGMIARRCNQITEIGKVLDPIADKLTQVTVVLCLAIRLPRLWPLLCLCFMKELLQSIGAAKLYIRKKQQVQAAKWYGKVSTVVFYLVMGLYVIFPPAPEKPLLWNWNMPLWLFVLLATLVASLMMYAFYQYTQLYMRISRESVTETLDKKGETTV